MILDRIIYCLLCISTLAACASPKSPTGGDIDKTPPKIIEEVSTPNEQVNFHEKQITVTFDEWVTLKDIYTQLVVSPLMKSRPNIRQKGKSLIITLPDSLAENTTYTLNFGNAIQDLNEGNILENYVFVFSTGPALDSINLGGKVIDAVTLKPAAGVWVMLYPTGIDSAVYKVKPDYLAKTDANGTWKMSYVRHDSFEVVALKDENLNFLYDQDIELFGFYDNPIYTDSSNTNMPEIIVFPKEVRTGIAEATHMHRGWLRLVLHSTDSTAIPEFSPVIDTLAAFRAKDTLHLWMEKDSIFSGRIILRTDTTVIRRSQNIAIAPAQIKIKQTPARIPVTGKVNFSIETPIDLVDTSRIVFSADTVTDIPFMIDRKARDPRVFTLNANWVESRRYAITFLPGAVRDLWGRTHDTIRHSVVVNAGDQFGNLIMKIDQLDSTQQYIVNLKEGDNLVDKFIVDAQSATIIRKNALPPAKYTIEIVEDRNRNQTWDTGNHQLRRQPELKMIFAVEALRAGWEQEAVMSWKAGSSTNRK